MRLLLVIFFIPLAGALSAPVGSLSTVGELPGEKTPVVLLPKERNPFTRREIKPLEVTADHESEESKLRALFTSMPVTGIIRGGDSTKVLLGSLILRTGYPIPAIIDNQTEHLVVGRITDKRVEILFVEAEARAEPRRILIPIDLRPHVTEHQPPLPTPDSKKAGAATGSTE